MIHDIITARGHEPNYFVGSAVLRLRKFASCTSIYQFVTNSWCDGDGNGNQIALHSNGGFFQQSRSSNGGGVLEWNGAELNAYAMVWHSLPRGMVVYILESYIIPITILILISLIMLMIMMDDRVYF